MQGEASSIRLSTAGGLLAIVLWSATFTLARSLSEQVGSLTAGAAAYLLRSNPAAYLLVLIAAIAWALYSNLARRWSEPGSGGAVELFVPATGVVLLVMRLFSPEPASWSAYAVVEASVLGAIIALAYGLWDVAMRKGNLLLVAASSYLTPLLSTLVSCAYLKVMSGSQLWAGCALIVVGSLVSWWSVSEAGSGTA